MFGSKLLSPMAERISTSTRFDLIVFHIGLKTKGLCLAGEDNSLLRILSAPSTVFVRPNSPCAKGLCSPFQPSLQYMGGLQ